MEIDLESGGCPAGGRCPHSSQTRLCLPVLPSDTSHPTGLWWPGDHALTSLLFPQQSQHWVVILILTSLGRFFVGACAQYLPEFGSRAHHAPLGVVGSLLQQIAFPHSGAELQSDCWGCESYFSSRFGMRHLGCDSGPSCGPSLRSPTHTKPPAITSRGSLSDFSTLQQCHWQCSALRAIRVSIRSLYVSLQL